MVQCSLDALRRQEMVQLPKQAEATDGSKGSSAAAGALSSGSEAVLEALGEGLAEVRDGVERLVRRAGFGIAGAVPAGDGVELLESQVRVVSVVIEFMLNPVKFRVAVFATCLMLDLHVHFSFQ
jgi:hypothetical protein